MIIDSSNRKDKFVFAKVDTNNCSLLDLKIGNSAPLVDTPTLNHFAKDDSVLLVFCNDDMPLVLGDGGYRHADAV